MKNRRIDRPILFSGPMVEALFADRKLQTRRVLKQQPTDLDVGDKPIQEVADYCTGSPAHGQAYYWKERGCWNSSPAFQVPYQIGDLLWVRETWARTRICPIVETIDNPVVVFPVVDNRCDFGGPWKPSIFMPRHASRLTLEVTDMRLQQLQDISEEDARDEGIRVLPLQDPDDPSAWWESGPGENQARSPAMSFSLLWDSLNAKRKLGWDVNPWVAALTFTVRKQNVDDLMQERGR